MPEAHPDDVYVPGMPLQAAEARLWHARAYMAVVEPLLREQLVAADAKYWKLVDEVLSEPGQHPRYGELGVVAASSAHDYLEEAKEQLPRVLFNSLLAYCVSMLEAMLDDCVEEAAVLARTRAPRASGRSVYQRRVSQLEKMGLRIRVRSDVDSKLQEMRQRRNAAVHDAATITGGEVREALTAVGEFLAALRAALLMFEERVYRN